MERRDFIKDVLVAACAVTLYPSIGSLMTGSTPPVADDKWNFDGWDFDEIVDCSGTWTKCPHFLLIGAIGLNRL